MHEGLFKFRREALRAFLFSRRNLLQPEAFGLPRRSRRRAVGLNREEVANLIGVSPQWYERIETQKGAGLSDLVLERFVAIFGFSEVEQRYFRLLAADEYPPVPATPIEDFWFSVTADARATVVFDDGFQRVRSNPAFDRLFSYGGDAAGLDANGLYRMFTVPEMRTLYPDWTRSALHMIGKIRWMSALSGHTPEVVYVLQKFPEFAALWDSHPVAFPFVTLNLSFDHGIAGRLAFRLIAPPVQSGYFAGSYIPVDAATARAMEWLVARSGGP